MDAVQLFLKQINVTVPQTFVLSGFSKVNSFCFWTKSNRIELNREDGQVRHFLQGSRIEKKWNEIVQLG